MLLHRRTNTRQAINEVVWVRSSNIVHDAKPGLVQAPLEKVWDVLLTPEPNSITTMGCFGRGAGGEREEEHDTPLFLVPVLHALTQHTHTQSRYKTNAISLLCSFLYHQNNNNKKKQFPQNKIQIDGEGTCPKRRGEWKVLVTELSKALSLSHTQDTLLPHSK